MEGWLLGSPMTIHFSHTPCPTNLMGINLLIQWLAA